MGIIPINELKENYSIVTLHGNKEIYIENFISIIELDNDKIKIKAKKEIVIVEGSGLLIEYMNNTDIKVSGTISNIRIVEVLN